ncbi:hypothetical protein PGTUg99_001860 [Puccinia graminis f. sp. tritici]|uniref:AB hydrolase-1 domain-containing protein n=2 Tax=Puccinia graminis f. sp. tritici TaxID=56615 RepID=A0A5B0QYH6_PUCGR|nr:hypothetical protein PGTUg99_000841 [Puccinia graminis f. sp. tritici]KAA1127595.1 hypothetical protein PGTUg99_001860 [Puccinia graminis f. sp. tritici]
MLCNVAADLPTLPTALDNESCVEKGLCPIMPTKSSHQPRHIYYEVHGDLKASQKIVLVMGMNFTCSAWASQVQYFSKRKDHVVLVFDNRGTGNSNAGAIEAYRTSDMAQDTVTLLNWLGWNQDRSLHLFGMSLGGMIAQELCLIVPKRFKSATFISTRCGSELDWPSKGAWEVLVKTSAKKANGDQGLDLYLNVLFPKEYMETVVEQDTLLKSDLREKLRNCHRLPREQAPIPFMGHFYAATMHHCPHPKLHRIAADLKPAKMLILTGGSDELIPTKRSLELHKNLPGSELVVLENAGHALIFQLSEEVNTIMERAIVEGNQAFKLVP